ncbi:unnamed protein product [Rhizophagus irregularis]|nr:unnamed protein product [Rhizophagus irregularis]CAB4442832.1 unnamed protein product [Rhizophagus irregularis]
MWSWLGFHVMTTEDMDPDDLQLITNQKIPDVDQSDPVHKPESMELGAKISIAVGITDNDNECNNDDSISISSDH